ncbi:MAG: hypothetical protein K2X90_04210 [Candidatus Babeliaceae bacterium]|nr:hypothetical protein [Candidatus Babeliaceae bacterium]
MQKNIFILIIFTVFSCKACEIFKNDGDITLSKIKKFCSEVCQEMFQQPDSLVAGIGFGIILHASHIDPAAKISNVPHLAAGLAIYGLYKSKHQDNYHILSIRNGYYRQAQTFTYNSASMANMLVGAATAYCALSIIGSFKS